MENRKLCTEVWRCAENHNLMLLLLPVSIYSKPATMCYQGFGFARTENMTDIIVFLKLPSFCTVSHNARVRFCALSSLLCNGIVVYFNVLGVFWCTFYYHFLYVCFLCNFFLFYGLWFLVDWVNKRMYIK